MDAAIEYAKTCLGLEHGFKPEQVKAIESFIRGEDTFVNLPTGHGKSLIYQAAPFCANFIRQSEKSIALVVSPLVALMRDQVATLKSRGISAGYVADLKQIPSEKRKLLDGAFTLVFASPETLLGPFGRELITSTVYQDNICGFFVDEGHCVTKWGFKSGKVQAFRECYSHLAQLRSLVPSTIPQMTLTATASPDAKKSIIKTLGMSEPSIVEISPNRTNIRYSVVTLQIKTQNDQFQFLLDEVQHEGSNSRKVIIFCQSHRHCRELHATFEEVLGRELCQHVGMFHSCTEETIKQKVLADFCREHSNIRILIATVAFGMGVHVEGLHTVIHYGPSRNIDDYFQESGRIGRDGKQSHAVILLFPKCFTTCKIEQNMKNYLKTNECRRKTLLEHYGHFSICTMEKSLCCDNCAGDNNSGVGWIEEHLQNLQLSSNMKEQAIGPLSVVRKATESQRQEIRQKIEDYRDSTLQGEASAMYTGVDMASGLSLELIDAIVKDCFAIQSLKHLQSNFPFFNKSHSVQIWQYISETLGNEFVAKNGDEKNSSSSDYEPDEELEVDLSDSSWFEDVHEHVEILTSDSSTSSSS